MTDWPHDDTRALIDFYGDPRRAGFVSNLVLVKPPWQMMYEGRPIRGVQIHRKCADSLAAVFNDIAAQVGNDWSKLPPSAIKFSGSYNYRPVRGSSRLSCHAFGAAIDLDAEENAMNSRGDKGTMAQIVIDAFKRQGWYWGGDFHSRQDPMHFQAANEGSAIPVGIADMPPMTDGHDESEQPQATIEEQPLQSQILEQSPNVLTGIKSLWKSKIALGSASLGTTAATTAVASDPETQTLVVRIAHQPAFWLALIAMVLAGYIIYCRWRDHGRGAIE